MMHQSLETNFYSKGRNDHFKNNVTYFNNSEHKSSTNTFGTRTDKLSHVIMQ